MTKKIQPVRGTTYTLREILDQLELRDSPCLLFVYKDVETPIQNSHFTDEQLKAQHPHLLNSFWRYKEETVEWIPVFRFEPTLTFAPNDLLRHLSIERSVDPFADDVRRIEWWAVPKGLPREQYYAGAAERANLKDGCGIDLDDPDWREKEMAQRKADSFGDL